jgi:hypothetical protein
MGQTPKTGALDSALFVTLSKRDIRATLLKVALVLYTSRIDAKSGTTGYTKTARLVASTTCGSGRGCLEQHRPARTRGNRDKRVSSTAHSPDRGANDAK